MHGGEKSITVMYIAPILTAALGAKRRTTGVGIGASSQPCGSITCPTVNERLRHLTTVAEPPKPPGNVFSHRRQPEYEGNQR
jgi:hypothetical protein